MDHYTKEELKEALQAILSMTAKCEKVQPKLQAGSAQETLLRRRVEALQIAAALIERDLVRYDLP